MPRPYRWNPMDVVVVPNLPASTPSDSIFREGLQGRTEGAPLTLRGQVNNNREPRIVGNRRRTMTGDADDVARSHVVFKKADLDAAGITLEKGWRFTQFGPVVVDYVISQVRYESPLNGDFLLVYAEFEEPQYTRASQ